MNSEMLHCVKVDTKKLIVINFYGERYPVGWGFSY